MRKQTVNMKLYKYDEVKEILKQVFTEKLTSLLIKDIFYILSKKSEFSLKLYRQRFHYDILFRIRGKKG